MLPVEPDKFDERKNELNEIKTAFNEFVAKVSIFDQIIGDGISNFKDPLLSYIKPRFDKLFDILYSTNENNRAKGIKDYSTNVPDARSKFESCDESERLPCSFKDLGKEISVLELTKRVVNNIYLKFQLNYYPLVIRKRISNCLYKLIDGKDSKETEEMRCDFPESYRREFINIILLRDLPNISEVISKAGFKPPFPDFFYFEYQKRFNCLLDVDILLKLYFSTDKFKNIFGFYSYEDPPKEKEININKLKKQIKLNEFVCDQANEEGLGTKEVINNVKNALKMLLDNLEENKEFNKNEISDYLETTYYKTENIVKSTYGLDDLGPIVEILA